MSSNVVELQAASGRSKSFKRLRYLARTSSGDGVVEAMRHTMQVADYAQIAALMQSEKTKASEQLDSAIGNIRSLWAVAENPKIREAKSMRLGGVRLVKHAQVDFYCTCHIAPAKACPSVSAGQPVTFKRVDLPDRIYAYRIEDPA